MNHDQRFKQLLKEFFPDFLALFFPALAQNLLPEQAEFLDKEAFANFGKGLRRIPDLVAKVPSRNGKPEIIVLHIEVQVKRSKRFRARMFEYYMLLRLTHQVPVFPIVLYLGKGTGGQVYETYTETLGSEEMVQFRYAAIGIPEMSAEPYVLGDNPLGWALSALMVPLAGGRLEQKYVTLERSIESALSDIKREMLIGMIDTYLPLGAEEEGKLKEKLEARFGQEEALRFVTPFERWAKEEGRLEGERRMLLLLLEQRFGELPQTIIQKIEGLQSVEVIDRVFRQALTAPRLEEINY